MSGRIRSIKPELLEDAVTAGISDGAFRLYVSAFLLSDDYGNFRADPRKLRGEVFWAQYHVTVDTVEGHLAELVEAGRTPSQPGLFVLYVVRGQVYGHIRNWEKHQKVDHPGQPRVPGPSAKEGEWFPPNGSLSRESRDVLAPDQDQDHDQDHEHDRPLPAPPADGSAEPPPCSTSSVPSQALGAPPVSGLESPTASAPEREVFEHWVAAWKRIINGTRTPKLDDKRRGKIRARLREQFTVDDLKRAVDGIWASEWNVEKRYYDIELVCRDASHVERFMALAPQPRVAPPKAPTPAPDETPPVDPAQVSLLIDGLGLPRRKTA